jgi:general secretion pathway protein M
MTSATKPIRRFAAGSAYSRAAALALAALLGALAYVAFVRPLLETHRRYEERIADLGMRHDQFRRAAQGRGAAQALLEQRRRADRGRTHYLTERNPALASAELQELVKRAVEAGGGELISTQVIGPLRGEGASEVTVKVRLRGSVRTLQRTLYALEAGTPILFVNNLSVDSASGDLAVGFEVTGHTRDSTARTSAVSIPKAGLAPALPPAAYEEIVARSLFAPSRRTAAERSAQERVAAPEEARAFSVTGVLIAGKRKLALVREAGSEREIRLRPGEGVGGWTLSDVRTDSVTMRNGTQTRVFAVQRAQPAT